MNRSLLAHTIHVSHTIPRHSSPLEGNDAVLELRATALRIQTSIIMDSASLYETPTPASPQFERVHEALNISKGSFADAWPVLLAALRYGVACSQYSGAGNVTLAGFEGTYQCEQ